MLELLAYGFVAYVVYTAYVSSKKGKRRKRKNSNKWHIPRSREMSSAEIKSRVEKEKRKMDNTFLLRDLPKENRYLLRKGLNCPGVYIFTNLNNGKTYVGQSVNILNRVGTHAKGRGSEDLYKDIMKGNEFIVQFIKLEESRHYDLNSLERYYIKQRQAYTRGYNKTRGNK